MARRPLASLALAVLAVTPAAAPAATGGTAAPTDAPAITKLECRAGCVTARSTAASLAVNPRGRVAIRGRNLASVAHVVFAGRGGAGDDVVVRPRRASTGTVDIDVPRRAPDGPLVVISERLGSSQPSRARLVVTTATAPRPVPRAPSGGAPPSASGLIWPLDAPVTSPFGPRWGRTHTGIDLGASTGTPIRAAYGGRVSLLGYTGGYGNFTCLAHTSITTCYAHQSGYNTTFGARVSRGQVIGYVGNTGNSFGAHLHFEVRLGLDPSSTPVNPLPYLPARSASA